MMVRPGQAAPRTAVRAALARSSMHRGGLGQAHAPRVDSMKSPIRWKPTMSVEDSRSEYVQDVRALARAAGLVIAPERIAQVEAVLRAWRPDAIRLAERISDACYDSVMPVTVFSHGAPSAPEGDAS
jgi:hypothetical protein